MIQLDSVRKNYGPQRAVDDLSLQVRQGEIFGLLGPNGAGKTTAMLMTAGLLRPDAGQVFVLDSGQPTDPKVRARIGVAPQQLSLYEELTAEENLRLFGTLYGLSGAALRRRTAEVLDLVQLSSRSREAVQKFSGGMKRRLNIAVALVHDPELLILDEPTVGVDPQSRNAIFDSIEQLRDDGRTVLYCTHYMEEAERLCDRVAILDDGRLLALDSVAGLVSRYARTTVIVLETDAGEERIEVEDPLQVLPELLGRDGVRGIRVDRPDLEAVFLALTGRSLRDS